MTDYISFNNRAEKTFPKVTMSIKGSQQLVDINGDKRTGYIRGCEEQKKIDVEKACQTMESFMSLYHIDRELMFRISKDVRKAMEE